MKLNKTLEIFLGIISALILAGISGGLGYFIFFASCVSFAGLFCGLAPFIEKLFYVSLFISVAVSLFLTTTVSKSIKDKKPIFAKSLHITGLIVVLTPLAYFGLSLLWQWLVSSSLTIYPS